MIPLLKIKTDEGARTTRVHACAQNIHSYVYAYLCQYLQTAVAVNLRMRTVPVCVAIFPPPTPHTTKKKSLAYIISIGILAFD